MSKTGWIILIICLCLVLCICAGLFLAGRIASSFTDGEAKVDTNTYKDLKNPYSSDGSYTIKTEDLRELTIDWISGSVKIELTDGDVIRIQETAERSISEKNALRYGVGGGKLRIQACKKDHLGKLPPKDLVVSLPRSLAEGLLKCEFNTVSASISAKNLSLDKLKINTVSGKVILEHFVADEATVYTVSGNVDMDMCGFGSLRLDSVSGEARFSGEANKIKSSSVSGKVGFTLQKCREIKVSTMSGDITMAFVGIPNELQIDTASGTTYLTLSKDGSCTIDLNTMSGNLYLNDTVISEHRITLGEGSSVFGIDSMSGNVFIRTK